LTGSLIAGDFNGDGKPDIAAAVGASIAVLLGNGDGTFVVSSFPTTAQAVGTLAEGDFNGDGKLDLAFSDSAHNLLHTLLGNGDGTFTEKSTTVVGLHHAGVAAGDFNGDGNLDVAVVNQGARNVTILLGKGDGTFSRKPAANVGKHPGNLTVADLNGDGKLDLAVVNNADNTLSILLGQGDGTFKLASTPATGISPYGVTASDFNGDGKIDLAVTKTASRFTSGKERATRAEDVQSDFAKGVPVGIMRIGWPYTTQARQNFKPQDDPEGRDWNDKEQRLKPARLFCPRCRAEKAVLDGTRPAPPIHGEVTRFMWRCEACGKRWEDDGVLDEE